MSINRNKTKKLNDNQGVAGSRPTGTTFYNPLFGRASDRFIDESIDLYYALEKEKIFSMTQELISKLLRTYLHWNCLNAVTTIRFHEILIQLRSQKRMKRT